MNHFSLNITFFTTFPIEGDFEELTLELYTAEYTNTTMFINGVKMIDTGFVECHSVVWGDNLGYYNETESCCIKPNTVTMTAEKGRAYHFEILYLQWAKPRNGLCIRLLRESASLAKNVTDLEARSATELHESPFIVHSILSPDFLDITQSKVVHLVHYNYNTRLPVADDEI